MAMTVSRISPEELKVDLEKGVDVVVLDVRNQASFDANRQKIKGAVRIPPDEIQYRYEELPRNKSIVTYCT